MSYLRDFNKDPLNHRYIDSEQMILYIFAGFTGKISQNQKKKLIKKYGRPRPRPIKRIIDTKNYVIDFGEPVYATQVILFHPDED